MRDLQTRELFSVALKIVKTKVFLVDFSYVVLQNFHRLFALNVVVSGLASTKIQHRLKILQKKLENLAGVLR